MTRREFLKSCGLGVAALLCFPQRVLAAPRQSTSSGEFTEHGVDPTMAYFSRNLLGQAKFNAVYPSFRANGKTASTGAYYESLLEELKRR